jgi:hypothetical protein
MSAKTNELPPPIAGERRFFGGLTVVLALLVFAGFARTYYLHNLFQLPAPSLLLVVHGALMSAWILLLAVQSALISARRVHWHQMLGVAGSLLAALIIPLGCSVTIGIAQREVRAHSSFVSSQLNVLGLELTQLLLFSCFIGLALWYRKRAPIHKRLMIVATLCIVPNAIVRLSLLTNIDFLSKNISILSIWALFVVGVIATDSLRRRRINPAFGWSASIAIAALYIAWYISRTAAWNGYWVRVLA